MNLDRLSTNQRHILNKEAEDTFSVPMFHRWIIPYSWEVGGQSQQLLARLGVDHQALLLYLLLVLRLRLGEDTQLVVPLGFQAISDKPVRGIYIHITSTSEFRFVLCPLHVLTPQHVGLGNSRLNFLLNR